MGKLFELLAVEGDLQGRYRKIADETVNTFTKKPQHFLAHHKRLKMIDDSRAHEEASAEQQHAMSDTVPSKLGYYWQTTGKYIDAVLQKETANQIAKADLVVDGTVIFKDAPAQFLLNLEHRLKEIRTVYEGIPTLAPGIHWKEDKTQGAHVHLATPDEVTAKTESDIDYRVVVEPTDHHPAQVVEYKVVKNVGNFITTKWSGMLSVAEKSNMLDKLDSLLRATKKARQRANTVKVPKDVAVADSLINFLMKG